MEASATAHAGRMRRSALLLFLLGQPALLDGQNAPAAASPAARFATLTAGIGNAVGWIGLQGERYLAGGRLSAFVGAGYTRSIDAGDPSGPSFAAGIRGVSRGGFTLMVSLGLGYAPGVPEGESDVGGRGAEPGLHLAAVGPAAGTRNS